MSRTRSSWNTIRAHREAAGDRHETALRSLVQAVHPPVHHAFVEWNREPEYAWPGVSADTGPVTIYGPDGIVRERMSAQEFRRRHPPRFRTMRR